MATLARYGRYQLFTVQGPGWRSKQPTGPFFARVIYVVSAMHLQTIRLIALSRDKVGRSPTFGPTGIWKGGIRHLSLAYIFLPPGAFKGSRKLVPQGSTSLVRSARLRWTLARP